MTTQEKTSAPTLPAGFGVALVDVGGRFNTASEMAAEAKPLGMKAGPLYLRGRIGILGTLTPIAAGALLGSFPQWVLDAVWESSAGQEAEDLVAAYSRALVAWGSNHLAGLADAERTADLIEPIVDAADPSALPLFAGWRAAVRPQDPPARAAHLLMVLRELRGGLHFAALRAHRLDVPVAGLVDPRGGEARLRRLGWTDQDIAELRIRSATVPDAVQRWNAAEQVTDASFASCLAVLDTDARAELATLIATAESCSRPASS
jgi:hypothetical protein